MLLGEYHHNIDEKNRLVIPGKFRNELGEEFIVTRGIEKCLYVYSKEEWNKVVNKLNALPFTKKDVRIFTRSFYASANACLFDKSGRIVLTDMQKQYSEIEKECVIIGVNNRLEIWSKTLYEEFMNENSSKLEDIAENLFEVSDAL